MSDEVMQPLLSIMIPTYNRAECLRECLENLSLDVETVPVGEVEIFISDNCSTDDTEAICREYAAKQPEVFRYVRQERNIGPSDNFTYMIRNGRGKFLKFQQDRFAVEPGTIGKILGAVKKHESEHPLLFFGNEYMVHLPVGDYAIKSYDDLADKVSYWTTWIGGYGLWRDEANYVIPIQDQFAASMLQQVAVVWALFEKNRVGYLYNFKQYHDCAAPLKVSGGYNVAEVFCQNYLGIVKQYLVEGKLTRKAYEREKKRLYFGHIYGMYFDFERIFNYKNEHFLRYTREYRGNWYYWLSLAALPIFYCVGRMPPKLKQLFFNSVRYIRGILCRS